LYRTQPGIVVEDLKRASQNYKWSEYQWVIKEINIRKGGTAEGKMALETAINYLETSKIKSQTI
jgi:hypothetical protein